MNVRLVLAVIAGTAIGYQASAQELQNGDFESPGMNGASPSGWTVDKGTFTCDAAKHKGGKFSGKLDGADHDSAAYQDVPVTPGSSYILSGVWRNGDKTAAFDVARASITWLTAPGGSLLSNGPNQNSGEVVSNWGTFKIGPVTAPADAGAARIRLAATFNTAAFDEITWEPASGTDLAGAPAGGAANPVIAGETKKQQAAPSPIPHVRASEMPVLGAGSTNQAVALPTMPTISTASDQASPGEVAGAIVWSKDVKEGYRAAAQAGKRILVFFTAGDQTTKYLDSAVFSDANIQGLIADNYVPVRLDYGANRTIADKLRIKAPGTVVLYDDSGRAIGLINEKVSVTAFEKALKKP